MTHESDSTGAGASGGATGGASGGTGTGEAVIAVLSAGRAGTGHRDQAARPEVADGAVPGGGTGRGGVKGPSLYGRDARAVDRESAYRRPSAAQDADQRSATEAADGAASGGPSARRSPEGSGGR